MRSELPTTRTLLAAIVAAAMTGLIRPAAANGSSANEGRHHGPYFARAAQAA